MTGDAEALAEHVRRLEPHAINFAFRMTADAARAEALFVPMIVRALASLDLHRGLEGAFRAFREALPAADAAGDTAGVASEADDEARWLARLARPTRERVVLRLYHRLDPALVARLTGATAPDEVRRELLSVLAGVPHEDACPGCGSLRAELVERLAGELAAAPARALDEACDACSEHRALRDVLAQKLARLAALRGLPASSDRRARVLAHETARRAADAYRGAIAAPTGPRDRRRRLPLVGVVMVVLAALAVARALDLDRPSPAPRDRPASAEPALPAGVAPGATSDPAAPAVARAIDPEAALAALARAYPAHRCLALALDPARGAWDAASRPHADALLAPGERARAVLEAAASDPLRGPVAVLVLASTGDAAARGFALVQVIGRADAAPDAVRVALRTLGASGGTEGFEDVARSAARATAVRVEAARWLADGGTLSPLLDLATSLGAVPRDLARWREALGGERATWLASVDLVLADPAASVVRRLAAARLLGWAGRVEAALRVLGGDGDTALRAALLPEHVARAGAGALELLLALADRDADARVRLRALVAVGMLAPNLAPEDRAVARHALLDVVARASTEAGAAAGFVALGAAGHPATELALELERAVEEDGPESRRRGAMRAIAALGLVDLAPCLEGVARGRDGPDRNRALVALGRLGGASEVLAELAAPDRRGGPVPAAALARHLAGVPLGGARLGALAERHAVEIALDDPLDALDLAHPTVGGLADWLAATWRIELDLGARDRNTPLVDVADPSSARVLIEVTTGKRLTIARGGRVSVE